MKNELGGKGANLAEMCLLKLPVPAGLTITTECCTDYYKNNCKLPKGLMDEVHAGIKKMEKIMGMKYGDPENPLLVSCRSGARKSMPGMMDTVLNIGLCSKTIPGLIKKTGGNERFVYDSYRRLIMMYADVVMEKAEGIEPADGQGIRKQLDDMLDAYKEKKGYASDTDLTADDLKKLAESFKARIKKVLRTEFPDDAEAQLEGGIKAVFKSWNGKKAVSYRRIEGIPDDWGTAVNVQTMVFGNMGDTSATGVAFTRNPATGDNQFYGEWLINAQGEDVVAGIRTPNPLNDETKNEQNKHMPSMQKLMPETYKELCEVRRILEDNYHDMLDIEFTIQDGKLYMLQCRVGKRTGVAALTMALDMLKEGRIDEKEVVMRLSPEQLDELLHPIQDRQRAGPRRDEPRRRRRHACRRRYPDRPWRYDLTRRPRGPWLGQVLHRGLRRREDRLRQEDCPYRRQAIQGRRCHQFEWRQGLGLCRARGHDQRHREPALQEVHEAR